VLGYGLELDGETGLAETALYTWPSLAMVIHNHTENLMGDGFCR